MDNLFRHNSNDVLTGDQMFERLWLEYNPTPIHNLSWSSYVPYYLHSNVCVEPCNAETAFDFVKLLNLFPNDLLWRTIATTHINGVVQFHCHLGNPFYGKALDETSILWMFEYFRLEMSSESKSQLEHSVRTFLTNYEVEAVSMGTIVGTTLRWWATLGRKLRWGDFYAVSTHVAFAFWWQEDILQVEHDTVSLQECRTTPHAVWHKAMADLLFLIMNAVNNDQDVGMKPIPLIVLMALFSNKQVANDLYAQIRAIDCNTAPPKK